MVFPVVMYGCESWIIKKAEHRRIDAFPQARILEWVAFPSPGDLPDPWIEPRSPALQENSL